MKKAKSKLEETLALHIRSLKLPEPQREYRFAAKQAGGVGIGVRNRLKAAGLKDWRFDFAWVELMIAVELEGGTWINGGHSRGKGFEDDCIKYNHAQLYGWSVYRFTTDMVTNGSAIQFIERVLLKHSDDAWEREQMYR